jgi:Na+-driven multidrug efflux pump
MSFKALRPFPKLELKKLLGIGLPSGGENVCYSAAMTVILKIVNTFGTFVINTKVYASTFAWFSYLYSSAVGQASQVIIGNYMGAGEVDKVDKQVKITWRNAFLFALAISIMLFLFSDSLFRIFTDNPDVLILGKKIMFIEIFLGMGKSTNIILVRSLQTAGDIKFPTTIGIISMWAIAVGLGYVLGSILGLGLIGVWIAMALDEIIRAIIFAIRWKQGKWRTIRLTED